MMPLAALEPWEQAAVLLITALSAFVLGFVVAVFNMRSSVAVSPRRHRRRRPSIMENDDTDVEDELVLDHAPNWENSNKSDYQQGLRI